MSAPAKLSLDGFFTAYMIGCLSAERDYWMRRARNEKDSGAKAFMISLCVGYARNRNREIVELLREVEI